MLASIATVDVPQIDPQNPQIHGLINISIQQHKCLCVKMGFSTLRNNKKKN